jgi:UDP-N-acetylmuramyl pentapeptide phosphotransferase/UDP-N-acetylglucosamine-1-phosphate transferase
VWRLEKPNFVGDVIPASVGMTFLFVGAAVYGLLPGQRFDVGVRIRTVVPDGVRRLGLLGLFDDKYGSRDVGGFKGHIGSLLKGKPTTGAVKLIVGGVLALLAAFLVHKTAWGNLLLTATMIALGANTLNLLDTRPGRAQFGFFTLFALPITVVTFFALYKLRYIQPDLLPDDVRFYTPAGVLLGPLVFAAAIEWWSDARGKAMMGDTGSNLLGATGALAAAVTLPLAGNIGLLLILIAVNLVAERFLDKRLDRKKPILTGVR